MLPSLLFAISFLFACKAGLFSEGTSRPQRGYVPGRQCQATSWLNSVIASVQDPGQAPQSWSTASAKVRFQSKTTQSICDHVRGESASSDTDSGGSSSNGFSFTKRLLCCWIHLTSKCAAWRYYLTDCSQRLWHHRLVLWTSGGKVLLV